MLAELSHAQFEDWIHIFHASPWGEDRADMRMARIVWALLQPRTKKKLDENRFRFQLEKPEPPSAEEYRRKAMRAYMANGGRVPPSHGQG